jgi:hypothetical protein
LTVLVPLDRRFRFTSDGHVEHKVACAWVVVL